MSAIRLRNAADARFESAKQFGADKGMPVSVLI